MKTFKEYVAEGTGAAADELEPNKQKNDETKSLEPRSSGEKKFKDDHKIVKHNHPVAGDNQFDGSVQGNLGGHGKPEDHVGGKKHADGETSIVKQGNSPKGA
jgi:hypothetical protein